MKKLQFYIDIKAPKNKVWDTLWNEATYRKWTSAFTQNSHAVTDNWKEGSKVLFLDGKGDGMFSEVVRNIPGELMLIAHKGVMKNNEEQPANDETKKWNGCMESYALSEDGDTTRLAVEMDSIEDYIDYFSKVFPKALNNVKEIAEASGSF